jgi:conjugative relaxase-like TrwC/TraI family protein
MLRITKSRSAGAAKAYFREALRIADYYRAGDVVTGHWHGQGAARLGLTGEVHAADFDKLMDNRTPAGEKLTPRDKVNRVPGVDFTANAPKSVSLIYGLTGDERIVEAHRAAVQEMMRTVERDMKTRVRMHGKDEDRKTGNCVWAEFVHDVSRPVDVLPDPHLHTHAYLINVTWDAVEGRFKAAQIGDVKGEGEYYQAVYLAALAREMVTLGYGIERRGRWWDVDGISRTLIEGFSRRSGEIEAAAEASGVSRVDAKSELGKRTRQRKRDELSAEELRDAWRARLSPREAREVETVLKRARHGLNPAPEANVRELMRWVMGDSFANASAVSEKKLLRQVLERGYGAMRPAEALAALEASGVIRGSVGGRDWITTQEAHRQEQAIVAFARSGRNRCAPLGAGDYTVGCEFLNEQQRRAIRHV